MNRTVSGSDYHARCAGCVAKEQQIASLTAMLEAAERERVKIADQAFKTIKSWKDRTVSAETNLASAHEDVRALASAAKSACSLNEIGDMLAAEEVLEHSLDRPGVQKIVEGT